MSAAVTNRRVGLKEPDPVTRSGNSLALVLSQPGEDAPRASCPRRPRCAGTPVPVDPHAAGRPIPRVALGAAGLGILTSVALANALAVVPEDVAVIEPGDEATCLILSP